jgi:hypothetical protein
MHPEIDTASQEDLTDFLIKKINEEREKHVQIGCIHS